MENMRGGATQTQTQTQTQTRPTPDQKQYQPQSTKDPAISMDQVQPQMRPQNVAGVGVGSEQRDTRLSSSSESTPDTNKVGDPSSTSTNTASNDFTIVWQNLTYKVDSRPWHAKLRERIFNRSSGNDVTTNNCATSLDAEGGPGVGGSNPEASSKPGEKTILKGVCGDVKSRQLTGILGPSGAGKSTLLHCLFQNRTAGTTGRILVDSKSKKRLKVCFIPQKDYLNDWLTVREDLIFVSKLRSAKVDIRREENSDNNMNPMAHSTPPLQMSQSTSTYAKHTGKRSSITLIDHEENAFRVAELLGITNCLDVPIRRISGGQKKRLSVARELMSTPDILILDEPTTGLDSLTCNKMISVLRDLAHFSPHPMAVIVTIHQPQRSVFDQFDKTYFLSSKGRAAYDDRPQNVVDTIKRMGNFNMPDAKHNPASALIEIFSDKALSHVSDLMAVHQQAKFNEKYDGNYIKRLMRSKGDHQDQWRSCVLNEQDSMNSNESTPSKDSNANNTAATSIHTETTTTTTTDSSSLASDGYFISRQLRDCRASHSDKSLLRSIKHTFILTHRAWLSVIRNPTMTRSRIMFHTTLPLIMLLIFGTTSGSPNNCPTLGTELQIADMRKSMEDGVIKKNVEETRLSLENLSFFFIVMYGFGINIISTTASHYPLTIQMFRKETINGLYTAGPYFIAQTIADLPLEIIFPSSSVILAYSLSGQIASYMEWRMFAVTASVLLVCYTVHSLGLLFGSIFINDINSAVVFGQVSLFPPVMLSGFVIRLKRMPPWMNTLSELSFFKHGLKGVVASRYGFNICDCDEDLLPEDGSPITFKSIPPRVKNVLDYMFPKNQTDGVQVSEMFDKLGERFIKAQTFALNITSCDDVKPYAMTAFSVSDSDLLRGAIALGLMIIVLKTVTFSIVRLAPYRLDW